MSLILYENNLWNQNFGNILIRFSNKKSILKSVSFKVLNSLVFHGKALHPNTKHTLHTKKNRCLLLGTGVSIRGKWLSSQCDPLTTIKLFPSFRSVTQVPPLSLKRKGPHGSPPSKTPWESGSWGRAGGERKQNQTANFGSTPRANIWQSSSPWEMNYVHPEPAKLNA